MSIDFKKESNRREYKQNGTKLRRKENLIIDLTICGIHPFHPGCLSIQGGTDKSVAAMIER